MRTKNLIIAVLAAGLIAGATAACGDGSVAAAPGAAAAPTATAAPAAPSPNSGSASPSPSTARTRAKVSKARPSGSRNPQSGTQYAILRSSKLSTRQITYDLIEWYAGAEAVKACAEDGVRPAENDYCEGYYTRNNNKTLRTLTVDPDAPVRMTILGELKPVDLRTFLDGVGNGSVVRFDIDAARIMKLDHVYLP